MKFAKELDGFLLLLLPSFGPSQGFKEQNTLLALRNQHKRRRNKDFPAHLHEYVETDRDRQSDSWTVGTDIAIA